MCDDRTTDSIGYEIKVVNNLLHKHMIKSASQAGIDNVTIMHGWIIGFLNRNKDREIYQKDIEQKFGISRSTVTNILKLMEKKGYITRVPVPSDARLKRISLTARGEEVVDKIHRTVESNEQRLNGVLSEEERESFKRLIHKLRHALETDELNEREEYDD